MEKGAQKNKTGARGVGFGAVLEKTLGKKKKKGGGEKSKTLKNLRKQIREIREKRKKKISTRGVSKGGKTTEFRKGGGFFFEKKKKMKQKQLVRKIQNTK